MNDIGVFRLLFLTMETRYNTHIHPSLLGGIDSTGASKAELPHPPVSFRANARNLIPIYGKISPVGRDDMSRFLRNDYLS